MTRVAVILSGCGVYDGAEIHESTAALLALHRAGAEAVICAPSGPQMHVVNHVAGQPEEGETRDILQESARIARGVIKDITTLDVTDVDAVLLPGGFGAAKNLSTFAVAGADCSVNEQVEKFLRAAKTAAKPIGAMCIAPVILARVFGREVAPRLTIGSDAGTAAAINQMGAQHVECPVTESVVDKDNKIVTTPAYMLAQNIGEVFEGATDFVTKLLEMC